MNQILKRNRILAVSLSTRGFGYALMEGEKMIVECGKKRFYGDKNAGSLAGIERLIIDYQPSRLLLQDVTAKDSRRHRRIKRLHQKIIVLAAERKLKVSEISRKKLRIRLFGNEDCTKHDIAELLAKQFPDELASRLPQKRQAGDNADARMDLFDAVGLAVCHLNRPVDLAKS